jgi:hypothetical protein
MGGGKKLYLILILGAAAIITCAAASAAPAMASLTPEINLYAQGVTIDDGASGSDQIPEGVNTDTSFYTGEDETKDLIPPTKLQQEEDDGGGVVDTALGWLGTAVKYTIGLPVTVGSSIFGAGAEALTGKIVGWVFGSINSWLYATVLTGLNWVLHLLVRMMKFRIIVDSPGVMAPSWNLPGDTGFTYNFAYFADKLPTVKGIAMTLILIFMVAAGIRIMATSFTGSASYALRQFVPRAGFAIFGVIGCTWICQKILDLNFYMCSKMLEKETIWDAPAIRTFYNLFNQHGSASTAVVILILGLVLVFVMMILVIFYWLRMVGIMLLVLLSPIVFACYFNESTEYLTLTWFKVFASLVFIQFIHCMVLAVFSSVLFSGTDALEAGLMSVALLYMMAKIPKWMLKGALFGGGGSGRTVVNVAKSAAIAAA